MSLPKESIKKFYEGSEIFITGGSGFVGRVLIEKLLRSCNGIKKIYLLMRAKKGIAAKKRIEKLTDCKLFELLKSTDDNALNKLHVVEGDVKELRLGLSNIDYETLKNCSIIFHCAASVRFDDPISDAILLNTRGTREVCNLATKMKNLKAFIHVSTTFIQPKLFGADEIFYPADIDWRKMIEFAEKFDIDMMCSLEKKLTKFAVNTYTFSKHLGEQVCQHYKEKENLPIVIYRPSIITSAICDPIPGWLDNLYGPVSFFFANYFGINHVSLVNSKINLDNVPVDLCVKGMIIAASNEFRNMKNSKDISVYNSSGIAKISFETFRQIMFSIHVPTSNAIMYHDHTFTKCGVRAWIIRIIEQIIPAIVFDGILLMIGQKRKLLRVQRIIFEATRNLIPFSDQEYHFTNYKYLALNEEIPADEKKDFLMWYDYPLKNQAKNAYTMGLKVIFNQTDEDSAKAEKRYKFVILMSRTYQILAYTGLIYLIYKIFIGLEIL